MGDGAEGKDCRYGDCAASKLHGVPFFTCCTSIASIFCAKSGEELPRLFTNQQLFTIATNRKCQLFVLVALMAFVNIDPSILTENP